MSRATWSKDDMAWLEANATGLPPEPYPYLHAHQRWQQPGPRDHGRPQTAHWDSQLWKLRHPGMNRTRRALRWLEVFFA